MEIQVICDDSDCESSHSHQHKSQDDNTDKSQISSRAEKIEFDRSTNDNHGRTDNPKFFDDDSQHFGIFKKQLTSEKSEKDKI